MRVKLTCPKCGRSMNLAAASEDLEHFEYMYKCKCGCIAVVMCDKVNEVVEISWL